jgi:hypothetical protein
MLIGITVLLLSFPRISMGQERATPQEVVEKVQRAFAVAPECKEVPISGSGFCAVAVQCIAACKSKVRRRHKNVLPATHVVQLSTLRSVFEC